MDNYGARAHSYALQKIIENKGIEAELIDYRPEKSWISNIRQNLNYPEKFGKINPVIILRCLKRHHLLKKELVKYNIKSVSEDINDRYDLIFLGSDAVFNVMHPLFDKIYYGVGINTKKATYAPSCEYLNTNYELDDDIKESLRSMLLPIGVRDKNTQELLNNNGINDVTIIADPTLLYDFKEFEGEFKEESYILVYTFSEWEDISHHFIKFAKANNLQIISVGRICKWADKSYDIIDLGTWIAAFRGASYVITDSFHGTIFSVKNNKEFIVLSRKDKIAKISKLLDTLDIQRGIFDCKKSIEEYLANNLDYVRVQEKVNEISKDSLRYIDTIIEQSRKGELI